MNNQLRDQLIYRLRAKAAAGENIPQQNQQPPQQMMSQSTMSPIDVLRDIYGNLATTVNALGDWLQQYDPRSQMVNSMQNRQPQQPGGMGYSDAQSAVPQAMQSQGMPANQQQVMPQNMNQGGY